MRIFKKITPNNHQHRQNMDKPTPDQDGNLFQRKQHTKHDKGILK